jgi:hypothetical protein
MEFNINLTQLFKCDREGIGIITGDSIPKNNHAAISSILDNIGLASSKVKFLIK